MPVTSSSGAAPSTSIPRRSGAASAAPAPPPAPAWTRGAAAVAAALQPQPRHAVLDAQQLDVAAVRLHVGPHLVERRRDPLLQRLRVEPVDQHQAADHAVLGPARGGRRRPAPRAPARGPRRACRSPRRPAARRRPGPRGQETCSSSSVSRCMRCSDLLGFHLPTTSPWAVHHLPHLALAAVHVHAAGQARIERAHRPHDVHALELVRAVLLEDRRVLHRVLVGPRRAVSCHAGSRSTASAGRAGSWRSCRP